MNYNILFAGFGGQGILFAGKVIAYIGLYINKNVSWLPSYGPEMRGGTANCSVCVSDKEIGCPMVVSPNNLIVMNIPSFERFSSTVDAGGRIFMDSSLISLDSENQNIECYKIPATQLAKDNQIDGLANMIILGNFIKISKFSSYETVKQAVEYCLPKSRLNMLEPNFKALQIGYSYK